MIVDPVTVVVTPMRRRHLRAVLRIEEQVYARPWTSALFLSELALRTTRAYFVARVGRQVVGYAGVMVSFEDAHVTNIAVDPGWQRHGVATRLLVALVRESLVRGAQHMTLEVRVSNRSAQDLYRRFGFAPVGVRKNYYPENREDALVMWVHDVDTPEYAQLLAGLEQRVPGDTVFESGAR
ncbi:MAG: ribosomal protein S18-alanine N-acetyltransferase [Actinomycetota bacterium]